MDTTGINPSELPKRGMGKVDFLSTLPRELDKYLYHSEPGIVLYCGDSREVLPLIPAISLVLTDPPYGIDWNTDYTRFTRSLQKTPRKAFDKIQNDQNADLADIVFGSWELICWGAHLFPWKISRPGSWLVWDKRFDNGTAMLADAEMAWWSEGHGVYIHKHTWQGMIQNRSGIPQKREHPNEKPAALFSWCIQRAKAAGTIVDPFCGSGPALIAAKHLGRQAIGIEIEERYCAITKRRLGQGVLSF